MRTRLKRIDGSVALAVPSRLLEQLRLRAGSVVDIAIHRGNLVLRPARGARPTLASVEANLAAAANAAEASNAGAADAVARERAEAWRAENSAALDSSNAYVETRGLPLTGHRKFR